MHIYCNRLPIHFDEQGIPCLHYGHFADKASPTCFEHQGEYLEWIDGPIPFQPAGEITWRKPVDLNGKIQPYLLEKVRDLLAKTGTASLNTDRVRYIAKGRTTTIQVELDLANAAIWLLLSSTLGTDLSDIEHLKASISALSGMALSHHIRIGSWEPIITQPNSLPDLIFSGDDTQHHTIATEGIRKFGPLSRTEARFSQPVHVVWIARRQQSNTMSHFLSDFFRGVQGTYEEKNLWELGWEKTYHFLGGVESHRLEVADYSLGLREQVEDLLERLKAEGKAVSLLLYEKEDIHSRLEIFCLHQALPCYRIPTSDFVPRGPKRAKLLETLGIVLYAKLGGIPWRLPLPKTLHRQYVVGIGSEDQGLGTLGYATVFGAQGNYHLGEATWAASNEAWNQGLARFVINQIHRLRTDGEFQDGNTIDLIFHLDRPWEERQRRALRDAFQEEFGGKFTIEPSFVHLGFDHPYRLWTEPIATAPSGTLHILGDRQRLLQLGDNEEPPLPRRPVLATLLGGSEGVDFGFLCTQIHTFASLSWTGVRRTELPASLLYGQRIASKIATLRIETPDLHIPEAFKSIPWYL